MEKRYRLYLWDGGVELRFYTSNREEAEVAARLLKLAGVEAEVRSAKGAWRVWAHTDVLAGASEELRRAVREVVGDALKRGYVEEERARL